MRHAWEAIPNYMIMYLLFTVKPSDVTSATGLSHFGLPLFSVGVLSLPILRVQACTTECRLAQNTYFSDRREILGSTACSESKK